jgi:hypothetical protein
MPLSHGIILSRQTQIKQKICTKKTSNLCYYCFSQFDISCNYGLNLNYLNLRTRQSRRHLDALFLFNVFKCKINFHSTMDTVGIRVCISQLRELSTFSVSKALSRPARCVIAANAMQVVGQYQQKQCLH